MINIFVYVQTFSTHLLNAVINNKRLFSPYTISLSSLQNDDNVSSCSEMLHVTWVVSVTAMITQQTHCRVTVALAGVVLLKGM